MRKLDAAEAKWIKEILGFDADEPAKLKRQAEMARGAAITERIQSHNAGPTDEGVKHGKEGHRLDNEANSLQKKANSEEIKVEEMDKQYRGVKAAGGRLVKLVRIRLHLFKSHEQLAAGNVEVKFSNDSVPGFMRMHGRCDSNEITVEHVMLSPSGSVHFSMNVKEGGKEHTYSGEGAWTKLSDNMEFEGTQDGGDEAYDTKHGSTSKHTAQNQDQRQTTTKGSLSTGVNAGVKHTGNLGGQANAKDGAGNVTAGSGSETTVGGNAGATLEHTRQRTNTHTSNQEGSNDGSSGAKGSRANRGFGFKLVQK